METLGNEPNYDGNYPQLHEDNLQEYIFLDSFENQKDILIEL